MPDGVFRRDGENAVTFHGGPAPSREDIGAVAARVQARMRRWLRRRGLLDERPAEERSDETSEPSPLEACMQMSLFGGAFLRLAADGTPVPVDNERFGARRKSAWAAEAGGFDVHAGVTVRAGDREGLERLCRYCARPPFALERISLLPDGRVAYLLRKPRRNGATHLVLEPIVFMARIASLIPPPRYPLLRLSGVLGPRSSWRGAVVARAQAASSAPSQAPKPANKRRKSAAPSSVLAGNERRPTLSSNPRPSSEHPTPNTTRTSLGSGVARPIGATIDWATLIRRVYLEDVLSCPCGGRRRILAHIEEPGAITAILEHLRLPTVAPPIARARSPGHAG